MANCMEINLKSYGVVDFKICINPSEMTRMPVFKDKCITVSYYTSVNIKKL